MKIQQLVTALFILSVAGPQISHAQPNSNDDSSKETSQNGNHQNHKKKKKKNERQAKDLRNTRELKTPNDTTSHAIEPGATELQNRDQQAQQDNSQNNRMKTLEGSSSRFSGQLNLTYNGSSLSHPFSAEAPNPGGEIPPPLVTLSGTGSLRYRIDKVTTAGLGTGVTTQTPFQGPKNTTVSDPYVDIARSYKTGVVHHRVDFSGTLYTNQETHDELGYRFNLNVTNESFYKFPFGLTAGFVLGIDYNFFSDDEEYSSIQIKKNQTQWDLITDPYFEYELSQRVNLRSVIGIQSLNNRDMQSSFAFYHPKIYMTLGVGVQILDAWFVYPFVRFYPYKMTSNDSIVGFNTIINLF